eukprot:scaffold26665_cov169-Skeletonema_menzelii.AAC.1
MESRSASIQPRHCIEQMTSIWRSNRERKRRGLDPRRGSSSRSRFIPEQQEMAIDLGKADCSRTRCRRFGYDFYVH